MKTKHTPLPWEVGSTGDDGRIRINSEEQRTVAYVAGSSMVEVKANAEFIVKAVNCHEELLQLAWAMDKFLDADLTNEENRVMMRNMIQSVIAKAGEK